MTGVHARFPPQAGIWPGVDAGLGRPDPRPRPPPSRRLRRREGGGRGAKVALADPCSSTGLLDHLRGKGS